MKYQVVKDRQNTFLSILRAHKVSLAYFFGSQKELGPLLLKGQQVTGAPESDLDLGVVLLEHPYDYHEAEEQRRRLQEELADLFSPIRLHVLLLEEENAHVQHAAAIKGIPAYAVNEENARQYRQKVYALYGDWHSWW